MGFQKGKKGFRWLGEPAFVAARSKKRDGASDREESIEQQRFCNTISNILHPSKKEQVFEWQSKMLKRKRPFLFCFAGAPRPGRQGSIRGQIFDQCRVAGNKCKLLECAVREESKWHQPGYVMGVFQSSDFCLQPSGDSHTRRSIFDSILAGCIPVFFHPGSAYVQYFWHLPKDYESYSVFISEEDVQDGKVSIEEVLSRIPMEKVNSMRDEAVKLIPRIIYADPRVGLDGFEDAFDVTIKHVLERVDKVRRGVDSSLDVAEELTWKYSLSGTVSLLEKKDNDHINECKVETCQQENCLMIIVVDNEWCFYLGIDSLRLTSV